MSTARSSSRGVPNFFTGATLDLEKITLMPVSVFKKTTEAKVLVDASHNQSN